MKHFDSKIIGRFFGGLFKMTQIFIIWQGNMHILFKNQEALTIFFSKGLSRSEKMNIIIQENLMIWSLIFLVSSKLWGIIHNKSNYLVKAIKSHWDLKNLSYKNRTDFLLCQNSCYKKDWKFKYKRCNFSFPRPNILIFFVWRTT